MLNDSLLKYIYILEGKKYVRKPVVVAASGTGRMVSIVRRERERENGLPPLPELTLNDRVSGAPICQSLLQN